MTREQITPSFRGSNPSCYDAEGGPLAPIRDALHLLMNLALAGLPDDARLLVVGVGSGAELISLATHNPGWRFVAVDPAASSLAVCQQRLAAVGASGRCVFHEGYLDSLNVEADFDAATAILVSHFLPGAEERALFFREIHRNVRAGGLFVNADLVANTDPSVYPTTAQMWMRMQKLTGLADERLEAMMKKLQPSLVPPEEFAAFLTEAGFANPTQFFQTILIHAWCSQRP